MELTDMTLIRLAQSLATSCDVTERRNHYTLRVCYDGQAPNVIEAIDNAITAKAGERLVTKGWLKEDCHDVIGYEIQKAASTTESADVIGINDNPRGLTLCRKLKEVQAVKVDADNIAKMQEFCGNGEWVNERFEFVTNQGTTMFAQEGDFITFDGSKISVLPKDVAAEDWERKDIL